MAEATDWRVREDVRRMLADAVLPSDIRPDAPASNAPPRVALLTGVCGFLGRRVAYELLRQPDLRLLCLARTKGNMAAASRVSDALAQVGVTVEQMHERVEVIEGDIGEHDLGLDVVTYAQLASRVDLILHCAAVLDWVRSYRQLYRANIGGVLEIIRLAARGRAKRVVFTSSIAVCYARGGPPKVDEYTDMLPHIGGMPVGYAQSKCVAEALLRMASASGVPVTVVRPALISGDSASGSSNQEDFLAALIHSCVHTGMAIDVDWLVDCVPVDFVAQVVAGVPQGSDPLLVLNLTHERPRHWRELVLWMNLHGYPVELVENSAWVRHLFDERHAHGMLLYPQRRFFRGDNELGGGAPYDTYLGEGQRHINASATRAVLDKLDIRASSLSSGLLHKYFRYYRKAGLLGPAAGSDLAADELPPMLEASWCSRFFDEMRLSPSDVALEAIESENSILGNIASARLDRKVGLWRVRFPTHRSKQYPGVIAAVLKTKVSDSLMQDLIVQLAALCRPELGSLFRRFPRALGLTGAQERELALYEIDEPRLRQYMPACYAIHRDITARQWALLLEYLPEAEACGPESACLSADSGLQTVLTGLGVIHSVWYQREAELASKPWLGPRLDITDMVDMMPLWRSLADFAANWLDVWCGPQMSALQKQIIEALPQWWPRLHRLPVTLIHNDFNPRNIVLRTGAGTTKLCAFDWELATVGVPQHDLAELLCFTWQGGMTAASLTTFLESHRRSLAAAGNWQISKDEWREGFALALQHLLINRLAMYTLMHRFRPLSYLPKVMRNWIRLYELSECWLDPECHITHQSA